MFSATLMSGGNMKTWGHFVVNGAVQAKIYVHNDNIEQATQTVIVNLNEGDDVSIQSTHLGGGIIADKYSSFAGFLLYPAEDPATVLG